MSAQPNNPLHGITLQNIVEHLVQELGWEKMGEHVNIKCFKNEPSVKSSLKFLRRTPWARKEVEELYLDLIEGHLKRKKKRSAPQQRPKPIKKRREEQEDDGLDW